MPHEAASGTHDVAVRVAWAKSWPYDGAVTRWAPLWRHLDDTSDIVGMLWDHWLADDIRQLVTEALPGGGPDARRLLRFVAGVHDVGKASPAFACQVAVLSDRMVRAGLRVAPGAMVDRTKLRHEVAGAAGLDVWLAERTTAPRSVRRRLTGLVAGHHGAYPSITSVQGAAAWPHLFGDGPWAMVREQLIDRAATRAGLDPAWAGWAALRLTRPVGVLLTAVIVMADWIASSDYLFPLDEIDDVPEIDAASSSESLRAHQAWERLQLSSRWRAPTPAVSCSELFVNRFPEVGAPPHPLQVAVVEAAHAMPAPGLLVVEAPMGSGKTEAALLAAEVLARRTGAGGVFVALPTQATSDAMFSRVKGWLERVPSETATQHSLALVHGKAALNDDAAHLPALRVRAVHDDGEAIARRAVVPAADLWMRGRKRAGLASFVVGTIDQVLFGALIARHVMLRHLALAGKVVVVDEVHAADSYMATFLDRTLEWLGAAGAPVVLLSATLPSARRAELYRAYEIGRRRRLGLDLGAVDTAALAGDIGYPVVVTSGADAPVVRVVEGRAPTAQVELTRLDDDLVALGDVLAEALRDGGCAGVLRNTVARAQDTARYLEARFGTDVVTVAHARFLATDRRENDLQVLAELGRNGNRPTMRIVVGTQVLEQSLDVDFDFLVTDLAPVDLVLQRIGRLHRHRRARRPAALATPRCYVTGVDWGRPVPRPVRGSVHVYGLYPLLASAAVLGPHLDGAGLRLPDDIARLVQAAYVPGAAPPTGWEESWTQAAVQDARRHDERRRRAGVFLLQEPTDGDLYGLSSGGVGEIDEDSPQGQACVRESGDSIEVVMVQRRDGTDRVPDWVPAGGTPLPFPHVPLDDNDARTLARCTLRLPPAMSLDPATFDRVVAELERERFEGWDSSPLLKGQLALVVDDDRRASVAGFELHYDRRYGLTATAVESP